MGWNADGTFSRVYSWAAEAAASNYISSTKFDAENDAFATGIEESINKDGKNTPTADLPMGGNKHTGVGDGTARIHYPSIGQIQDGDLLWGGTSGGTANAQTISLTPAITALVAGMRIAFLPGTENTGAVTLNVNSLGATGVKQGGQNVFGGSLKTDTPVLVIYDGTDFELVSNSAREFCDIYDTTSAQSIAVAGDDPIEFASEASDLWAMHDAVDTERVAISQGVWLVTASIALTTAPDGATLLTLDIGGAATNHQVQFAGKYASLSAAIYSATATYLTVSVDNGGSGAAVVSTARMSVTRVG